MHSESTIRIAYAGKTYTDALNVPAGLDIEFIDAQLIEKPDQVYTVLVTELEWIESLPTTQREAFITAARTSKHWLLVNTDNDTHKIYSWLAKGADGVITPHRLGSTLTKIHFNHSRKSNTINVLLLSATPINSRPSCLNDLSEDILLTYASKPDQLLSTFINIQPDVLLSIDKTGMLLAKTLLSCKEVAEIPLINLSDGTSLLCETFCRNIPSNVSPEVLVEFIRSLTLEHKNIATPNRSAQVQLALNEHAIFSTANSNGIITDVNKRFCEVSGFSRSELIGQSHSILKSGVHDRQFYQELWSTITAGNTWHGIVCNRRKDGELYWVDATIVPFKDSQGQIVEYLSIRTDITKQIHIQSKLQESEEHLSFAVEGANDGIWDWDIKRNSIHFSKIYMEMLGYEEFEKEHTFEFWLEHLHPEDLQRSKQAVEDYVSGRIPKYSVQFRMRCKDGHYKWIHSRGKVVTRDDEGNPSRMAGFHSDISKEKQVESDLKLFKRVFHSSEECMAVASPIGEILYINHAYSKIMGFSEADVIGRNFRDFIAKDDNTIENIVSSLLKSHKPWTGLTTRIRKDGSTFVAANNFGVVKDEKGELQNIFVSFTDYTDEIDRQNELARAKEEAEQANQTKADFISSLSHEVRNPLNAISGYAQLLSSAKDSSSNVITKSKQITVICDYIIDLLRDVDNFSRVGGGQLDVTIERLSVLDIIDECKEVITPLLGNRRYYQDIAEGDVVADKRHLKQAIINFISNAIKYNRDQGRIFVSGFSLPNATYRIQVEDTGKGIPENQLQKVFTPFERLDWNKSEIEGLGLGLALTKALVEKMGGTVGIESEPELGTTIWLDLPEAAAIKKEPKIKQDTLNTFDPKIGKGKNLLLLEDNEFNQHFMTEQLQQYGFKVDVAGNGIIGLEKLKQNKYALILTDCNMPQMDGYEFTEQLRSNPDVAISKLPVIAITAHSSNSSLGKIKAAGMSDALIKPIKSAELNEKLQYWLKESANVHKNNCRPGPSLIIDQTSLVNYIGDNIQVQARLLQIFKTVFDENIHGLIQHLDQQELVQAKVLSHKLASSSLSVGAVYLSEILHNIEQLDNNESVEIIGGYIAELQDLIPRINEEIIRIITELNESLQPVSPKEASPTFKAVDSALRILVIDDDPFAISHARLQFKRQGITSVESSNTVQEALKMISDASPHFDIVLFDLNMPNIDGLKFVRMLSSQYRGEGLVIYSAESELVKSAKSLIDGHRMKFIGYLNKPVLLSELNYVINTYQADVDCYAAVVNQRLSKDDLLLGLKQGAIELVYQPQVNTCNQELIATEALARFRTKEGELLPPAAFIPLIEQFELDYALTVQVFEKAMEQLATWQKQGLNIRMAVNFSMTSVQNLNLPDLLVSLCTKNNISPKQVVVEITESELTSEPTVAIEVLGRMKLLGFTLSIDDFGTGYSSLEKLQHLPFSELKLDRSYVSSASHDDVAMAIMRSSISLAKQLNMSTVAEGVENIEDLHLAKRIGVDLIQGYLLTKPLPPEEFDTWYQQHIEANRLTVV